MPPSTTSFGELSRKPASLAPRNHLVLSAPMVKDRTSHTDPVVEREICCMGRNSNSYVRILVYPSDSFNDRRSSRASCGTQTCKICKPARDTRLHPIGHRITRAHKHHRDGLPAGLGSTHDRGDW